MTTATNWPVLPNVPLATIAEAEADHLSETRLPRYGKCHSCGLWLNADEYINWQTQEVWEAEPHCFACHHAHWRERHADDIAMVKAAVKGDK